MALKGKMWGVLVVIGVLLAMVPNTMQFRIDHPVYRVVKRVNDLHEGSFLGLILSYGDEQVLLDSGDFNFDRRFPAPISYAGRVFKFGLFKGVATIYVVTSSPMAYASSTLQILVDLFRIGGIIDYGSAGTVSDELAIGDVAVISAAAFTGNWRWENFEHDERSLEHPDLPSLSFGDFNYPKSGENKLASIEFRKVREYPISSNNQTFFFNVDEEWLQVAAKLKDLELESCEDETMCKPKVVYGVQGSSSDILVANKAYGKFLNEKLGVSTVDKSSAATISAAKANGVPLIVFRAATNKPGVPYDRKMAALGSRNSLKVAAAFVEHIVGLEIINAKSRISTTRRHMPCVCVLAAYEVLCGSKIKGGQIK